MRIEKLISWLTLCSGLSISLVAIYYSVSGLISIFTGAIIPILIMGTTLEISKLVATVWLKRYWTVAPLSIKSYLTMAIIILMMITSIGIYGFISKSHLSQSVSSNAVTDQIAIIDSKIADSQTDIEMSKKALMQLDSAVDQTMNRSITDKGALKSVKIRQSQKEERNEIKHHIEQSQNIIVKLKEEKYPLAQQLKKSEVEFGPITYIAALIYDNPEDKGQLEKAVRFVIILIVIVFDPLAITLLLASQYSFRWLEEENISPPEETIQHHFEDKNDVEVPDVVEEDKYNEKMAKAKWKSENKDDTLKHQEILHSLGLTEQLPWEQK